MKGRCGKEFNRISKSICMLVNEFGCFACQNETARFHFTKPLFLAHFPSIYIQFQFVCGKVFAQLRAQLFGRLQTWQRFKVRINKHYDCGNRQIGIVIIARLSAPLSPLLSVPACISLVVALAKSITACGFSTELHWQIRVYTN